MNVDQNAGNDDSYILINVPVNISTHPTFPHQGLSPTNNNTGRCTSSYCTHTTVSFTRIREAVRIEQSILFGNLAKLDCGLDESPTVMVGEATTTKKLGKNRGILTAIWAFVETKSFLVIE